MKKGLLTLVDVEEGLTQLTGENGLRQVSEILFHHVGHVERGVALVGNAAGVRLHQVAQVLDTGLHPRLPEKAHLTGRGQAWIVAPPGCDLTPVRAHLVQTLVPQVDQSSEDAGRQRLACLLEADEQRDPKDPPAFHLHQFGLPQQFRNSPADDIR